MSYLKRNLATPRVTPQNEPVPGRTDQVQNSAGGYVFEVDKFARLRRWLILGSEGGTFYASERKLSKENAKIVRECLAEDGLRVVEELLAISEGGRAPKQSPTLYTLALACSTSDDKTRKAALQAVTRICRTPTMLWEWLDYTKGERGIGRGVRKALGRYYTGRNARDVAYHVVKYRQRNGWTHRDTLRIAHPNAPTQGHQDIFKWVTKGGLPDQTDTDLEIIEGFQAVQKAKTEKEVAELVTRYSLPWEAVPSEFTSKPIVQEALLQSMPIGALVRNLGAYTSSGLLTTGSAATSLVIERLGDERLIQRGRIHPLNVLFALSTYKSGRGFRGTNTWVPVPKIVNALDATFYKAFGNVQPTGKRFLLALDISGSMSHVIANTTISCREASAAMAMVTMAVEQEVTVVGFATGSTRESWSRDPWHAYQTGGTALAELDVSPRRRLDDIVASITGLPFGGTDCALPMTWALEEGREYDAFIVYTDNETWAGKIQPHQALAKYRRETGIDARSVVVGMTSTGFSIADPKDAGMLDVVGFDTASPNIISEFVKGNI